MNDELRFTLEQYFDGELPATRHAETADLAAESEDAQRYLDRLAVLRGLARRHRPGVAWRGSRRGLAVVAAGVLAAAAGLAAILVLSRPSQRSPSGAVLSRPSEIKAPALASRRHLLASGPRLAGPEIALYQWANCGSDRADPAMSALVLARTRPGKRPPSVEMLAIELANTNPDRAARLEPLAFLKQPGPGGRSRMARHARTVRSVPPGA